MQPLTPCSSCHRHGKASEESCPFCGARSSAATPRVDVRRVDVRAPRAIVLGLGLAASVAAVACAGAPLEGNEGSGDASADANDAAPFDGGTVVPVYGAPACDV